MTEAKDRRLTFEATIRSYSNGDIEVVPATESSPFNDGDLLEVASRLWPHLIIGQAVGRAVQQFREDFWKAAGPLVPQTPTNTVPDRPRPSKEVQSEGDRQG